MNSSTSPKVFISYSHDSEKHKEWVRRLAERLCHDGVDIVLDQWEVGPGDDVTAFMEQSLSSCDRVVIICTDEYIRKANTLKGGVGYERMIITEQIARHLRTDKFIPLLRNTHQEVLPKFLGPRIYVDLRSGDIDENHYDQLLRTLHHAPRHMKPTLGRSPYEAVGRSDHRSSEEIPEARSMSTPTSSLSQPRQPAPQEPAQWQLHWHRAVAEHCGYRLYLILVRFTTGSIFLKQSLIADLRHANLANFLIFHLFSGWDLLIRVWADEERIQILRNRFLENSDLNKNRQPEFLAVHEHTHFSESETCPNAPDAAALLGDIGLGLAPLKDVQQTGKASKYFEQLRNAGLILDDTVAFDPDRIQFYVTIRSIYALEALKLKRLAEVVAGWPAIKNRSIYVTRGCSIGVVIKGQAADYYDIDRFLRDITHELASVDVVTETMLVANQTLHKSTVIDFNKAEEHLIDMEIRTHLPELGPGSVLGAGERLKLTAKYVEIRDKLQEDKLRSSHRLDPGEGAGSSRRHYAIANVLPDV